MDLSNFAQMSLTQIVLIAYVGALIGEMHREICDDEELCLKKFLIDFTSSGFLGTVAGFMSKQFIENNTVNIGIAGFVGYIGNKKAEGLITRKIDKKE